MDKMDEIILVVPRKKLFENEALHFQGVEKNLSTIAKLFGNISQNYSTMRRGDAEENQDFKQPIPYCIITRNQKEVFLYKRLSGGGETRLHDKYSIGAGGHMNTIEGDSTDFMIVLMENLNRELEEELDITTEFLDPTILGYINDDINEVGKVHIGILVTLDIDFDGDVKVRETEQLEGEWVTIEQLKSPEIYDKLESWSQIAADIL